jgi:hypothetical protein
VNGYLVEELRRLDPRDFLPDARYEFIVARLDVKLWIKQWIPGDTGSFVNQFNQQPQSRAEIRSLLKRIIAVLDKYGGEGWRAQTRSFSFLKDKGLREIIERDYKELTLVLFPGGAWKSADAGPGTRCKRPACCGEPQSQPDAVLERPGQCDRAPE